MDTTRARFVCLVLTVVLLYLVTGAYLRLGQLQAELEEAQQKLQQLGQHLQVRTLSKAELMYASLGLHEGGPKADEDTAEVNTKLKSIFKDQRTLGKNPRAEFRRAKKSSVVIKTSDFARTRREAVRAIRRNADEVNCDRRRHARSVINLHITQDTTASEDPSKCASDSKVDYSEHSIVQCWGHRNLTRDNLEHCYFELLPGRTGVRIKRRGNYLITVQLTFTEKRRDQVSGRLVFAVMKNEHTLAKCSQPRLHNCDESRPTVTCSTGVATWLENTDELSVKLFSRQHTSVHTSDTLTFISVAKL